MSDQHKDTRRDRGTKRSRIRSSEESSIQQPPPKRRVQAEFVAPQDVRMQVTQGGLDLRLERTDLDPTEDDMDASWLATTANQGFIGQGTTDLIRRQLDLIDALAPGTMLGFAMHPATKPNTGDQEGEASAPPSESAVGHKVPITAVSPSSTEASVEAPLAPPSPERPVTPVRYVRAPMFDHSGSPHCHLSPEYPPWFMGWDAFRREQKEWEEREERATAQEAQRVRTEARAERAARRRRVK